MIQVSFNLPLNKRLHLKLVKRRQDPIEPILPKVESVKNIRKGSKISRYFRFIFENKRLRRILGFNMPIVIFASSVIPQFQTVNSQTIDAENIVLSTQNTEIVTQKSVRYPTEGVKITQKFSFYHPALDIDGKTGDPIYPFMNGVVREIGFSNYGYGNAILINHGNGLNSLYAHLSKILVKEGDLVTTQTKIGEMGKTGRSTGDHLHFEIRKDGIPFDPILVLPKN